MRWEFCASHGSICTRGPQCRPSNRMASPVRLTTAQNDADAQDTWSPPAVPFRPAVGSIFTGRDHPGVPRPWTATATEIGTRLQPPP